MIFTYPLRAEAPRANRHAFRKVPNRHADTLPHPATFRVTGGKKFIRALSGVELGLVALTHDEAGRSPDIYVGDHGSSIAEVSQPAQGC